MSVYIIGLIEIHDRDEYNKYQGGFREIFQSIAARFSLSKRRRPSLRGSGRTPVPWCFALLMKPRQSVGMESEQYQALAQHRFRASRNNVILAKGRN